MYLCMIHCWVQRYGGERKVRFQAEHYVINQAGFVYTVSLSQLSHCTLRVSSQTLLSQEIYPVTYSFLCNITQTMSILEDEESLPFLHGTLKIHVIEAADLPDTDNSFFNIDRNDKTDPFVIISIGECELLKTAYIPNTLEPRWDEKFSIPVCHRASCLKVR